VQLLQVLSLEVDWTLIVSYQLDIAHRIDTSTSYAPLYLCVTGVANLVKSERDGHFEEQASTVEDAFFVQLMCIHKRSYVYT